MPANLPTVRQGLAPAISCTNAYHDSGDQTTKGGARTRRNPQITQIESGLARDGKRQDRPGLPSELRLAASLQVSEHSSDGLLKRRQILAGSLPQPQQMHAEVIVHDLIAHPGDGSPRHLGVARPERTWYSLGGLPDDS